MSRVPVGPRAGRHVRRSSSRCGRAGRSRTARDLDRRRAGGLTPRTGSRPRSCGGSRTGRLAGFFFASRTSAGFGGVADRLNAYNVYLGDPALITHRLAPRSARSPRTAIRGCGAAIHRRPAAGGAVGHRPRGDAAGAPPLDRKAVPPISPAAVRIRGRPCRRSVASGRGMPLWVFPRRDLPMVAGSIVIPGGGGLQPPERAAWPSSPPPCSTRGRPTATRPRRSPWPPRRWEPRSRPVAAGTGLRRLPLPDAAPGPSLDLAVDILRQPNFPEAEWRRVHGQTLAALRAERDSAEARAYRALLRALYGPGIPTALRSTANEETVVGLGR